MATNVDIAIRAKNEASGAIKQVGADLRNLERLGAIPKQGNGTSYSTVAKEAAAQFWRITETDLPVQAVLFSAMVMQ